LVVILFLAAVAEEAGPCPQLIIMEKHMVQVAAAEVIVTQLVPERVFRV
jgi:hypothetical protein